MLTQQTPDQLWRQFCNGGEMQTVLALAISPPTSARPLAEPDDPVKAEATAPPPQPASGGLGSDK